MQPPQTLPMLNRAQIKLENVQCLENVQSHLVLVKIAQHKLFEDVDWIMYVSTLFTDSDVGSPPCLCYGLVDQCMQWSGKIRA